MKRERLACVIIPDFPLQLCYRDDPLLKTKPLALTEDDKPTSPITLCNALAAEREVHPGMTGPQARVVCPELVVRPRDPMKIAQASEKILARLQDIGGLVEGSEGTYFMEVTGLRKLYKDESRLARKIIIGIITMGYPITVGIADSKFVARIAAETTEEGAPMVVPPGGDAPFIKGLDIDNLHPTDDTRRRLNDLGVKKIGHLAAFPSNEIAERFGAEGAMLSLFAHGRDDRPLDRRWPREKIANEVFLTYRLYDTRAIGRHIERLLQPLMAMLVRLDMGCSKLAITLSLENRNTIELTPSVDRPTCSSKIFARQWQQQLEQTRLVSAVTGIKVEVTESSIAALPARQVSLTEQTKTNRQDPKLKRLLKDRRIYKVDMNSAFLPEQSFELVPARIKKTKPSPEEMPNSTLPRTDGLRLLSAPVAVDMEIENGRPRRFRTRRGRHRIAHHDGPWQLSGDWWENRFDRLYYQLQTPDRRRFLFYYDRLQTRWFLQGVFD